MAIFRWIHLIQWLVSKNRIAFRVVDGSVWYQPSTLKVCSQRRVSEGFVESQADKTFPTSLHHHLQLSGLLRIANCQSTTIRLTLVSRQKKCKRAITVRTTICAFMSIMAISFWKHYKVGEQWNLIWVWIKNGGNGKQIPVDDILRRTRLPVFQMLNLLEWFTELLYTTLTLTHSH